MVALVVVVLLILALFFLVRLAQTEATVGMRSVHNLQQPSLTTAHSQVVAAVVVAAVLCF
jgi:flagellar biogenesis protein FliO